VLWIAGIVCAVLVLGLAALAVYITWALSLTP